MIVEGPFPLDLVFRYRLPRPKYILSNSIQQV